MCESHVVVCERLASSPEEIENVIKLIAKAGHELRQERELADLAKPILTQAEVSYEQ